jgi:hypothetical protein
MLQNAVVEGFVNAGYEKVALVEGGLELFHALLLNKNILNNNNHSKCCLCETAQRFDIE